MLQYPVCKVCLVLDCAHKVLLMLAANFTIIEANNSNKHKEVSQCHSSSITTYLVISRDHACLKYTHRSISN